MRAPAFALLTFLFPVVLSAEGETDWPGFRNRGNSVSHAKNIPLRWSAETGIAWRTQLAGYGQSSPVIHSGIAWVTSTSGANKEKLLVEGFDIESGERKTLCEFAAPVEVPEVTDMISRGAPTPVADATGVFAFFESGDLYAVSPSGETRWHRSLTQEFGEFKGGHGIGSSLLQSDDRLFLLIDHDAPSYLLCLEKESGATVWQSVREPRVSWTTPLRVDYEGFPQIVVSSNGRVDSYRESDGMTLWMMDGLEGNNVPSPTWTGELLLIGSSSPQQTQAIRLETVARQNGEPRLSPKRAWTADSVTSSFGSPLAHAGLALFVNRAGVLQANRLADGTSCWETRLPASTWASPVSAGRLVYCFCQDGNTVVLSPTEDGPGEPLAENSLGLAEGDRVYGVAIVDGLIVLRTGEELIAIEGAE